MALLKLHLDEFDEVDYELIAIHTALEDYRLAYFINQNLPVILSKNKEGMGIKTKDGEADFSIFSYIDESTDIKWSLVQNKNEIVVKKKSTGQNLFLNNDVEIEYPVFLLPELKKVDYFLKIENTTSELETETLLRILNTIDRITAVYAVIPEKIKSKNNLIF